MINKIKQWYLKPRKGEIFDYTNWITNDTRALGALMHMQKLLTVGLFTFLCFSFILAQNAFMWLFMFFLATSIFSLKKHCQMTNGMTLEAVSANMNIKYILEVFKNTNRKTTQNDTGRIQETSGRGDVRFSYKD